MNRANYFNYIDEKLAILAYRINTRGQLNILDLNIHAESFYAHFLNKLFDWKLENKNAIKQNIEAIDLVDDKLKIVIQVSATATKSKIESAFSKNMSSYNGYSFKFVAISKNAQQLKKNTYSNTHGLAFNPLIDIYDLKSILSKISSLDITQQKDLYDFIRDELGNDPDINKIETNLAKIINIMACEDWSMSSGGYQINDFEIDRKISYNNLMSARDSIVDYALFFNRLDRIYKEFDTNGINKSTSVLDAIKRIYVQDSNSHSGDNLFFHVIDCVMKRIQKSSNYILMPFEELEQCVDIIVVNAFIRCKIFKNPEGYNYASA